ncbi:hypothetical protein E2C01_032642 [Portunus trituberculatus]|uniref:Uncharacterized protein n=1 Tax=Portunus trituberculatus TaxID=210409 RepID=A0A5B7EWH7_PORTR|nr:hypothetical protein [Portunus trituberculatus]
MALPLLACVHKVGGNNGISLLANPPAHTALSPTPPSAAHAGKEGRKEGTKEGRKLASTKSIDAGSGWQRARPKRKHFVPQQ